MSETVESADAVEVADGSEGAGRPAQTMRRLIQGDLASLRVLIGLALIWAIFQFENDRFLSAQNLTNLMLQIAATGLISIGVVVISHNLVDVFEVADRIFVLRLGQAAGEFAAESTTEEHVVSAITGVGADARKKAGSTEPADPGDGEEAR